MEAIEEHCNKFMAFLKTKIASICSPLSCTIIWPDLSTYAIFEIFQLLNCFPKVLQQQVEDIIRKMKSSICTLDPFPSVPVKANILAISPLVISV